MLNLFITIVSAIVHRALGYSAIGLFALMALLGGLRGFEDPLRRITITLHWIFGHLFYVMMGKGILLD